MWSAIRFPPSADRHAYLKANKHTQQVKGIIQEAWPSLRYLLDLPLEHEPSRVMLQNLVTMMRIRVPEPGKQKRVLHDVLYAYAELDDNKVRILVGLNDREMELQDDDINYEHWVSSMTFREQLEAGIGYSKSYAQFILSQLPPKSE